MNWIGDIVHAWRGLRRAPGFAVAAVLTLALGLGVTIAVAAVANAVLRRPLPYPNAERLVRFVDEPSADGTTGRTPSTVDAGQFHELQDRLRLVSDIGVYTGGIVTLSGRDGAVPLRTTRMSASFFRMLGVHPEYGRAFTTAEERSRSVLHLMMSHGAWRRVFGGDPMAIGSSMIIDGRPATLVGVMPASFAFPDVSTDIWVPFEPVAIRGRMQRHVVFGALAPDVPLADASAEVTAVLQDMRGFPTPGEYRAAGEPAPFGLVGWKEDLVAPVRPALWLLVAASSLVLLLGCVNVATLLLARGTGRSRELATRIAVGASRGRVARLLLTESLLLATAGSVVGVGLGAVCLRVLATWGATLHRTDLAQGVSIPRLDEVAIDPSLAVIAAGLALASAATAGLWPAVRLSGWGATEAARWSRLAEGGTTRRLLLHRALLTAQVALATTLLVGGTLTMRSLTTLLGTSLGFNPDRVQTMRLAFPAGRYSGASLEEVSHRVVEAVGELEGVESAAYTSHLPLVRTRAGGVVSSRPPGPGIASAGRDSASFEHLTMWVHHDFFKTLGLSIIDGRALSGNDDAAHLRVVVVNEALVDSGALGAAPVGRQVYFGTSPEPWQVVGVVSNIVRFGLGTTPEPEVYFDARQRPALPGPPGRGPYLVIRSEQASEVLVPRLAGALRSVDRDATFVDVAAMDAIVDQASTRSRLYAGIMNVFALSALVIAVWGVASVVAYTLRQRRRELGIQLTLGATQWQVLRAAAGPLVLHGGLGVVIGLALAVGLAGSLGSILHGVAPRDPVSFALVAGLMAIVTTATALLTARRATLVDPAVTLRAE